MRKWLMIGCVAFASWAIAAEPPRILSAETPVSSPAVSLTPFAGISRMASSGSEYLVVWEDTRSSGVPDIFGARITLTGEVLDPFGFPIAHSPLFEQQPRVRWNGTNFVVAWSEFSPFSGPYGAKIYATTVAEDGRVSESVFVTDASFFDMATSGDVTALDVYPYDLVTRRAKDPAVILLDAALNPIRRLPVSSPSLVARNGDGFLIAWAEAIVSGSVTAIRGMRITRQGAIVDTTPLLIVSMPPLPSAAGNDGNDSLLAFGSGNILIVRVRPDGTIRTTAASGDVPVAIEPLDSGYVLLSFSSTTIVARHFTSDDTLVETQIVTSSQHAWPASVAAIGQRLLTTWTEGTTAQTVKGRTFGRFNDGSDVFPIAGTAPRQDWPLFASEGRSVLAAWNESTAAGNVFLLRRMSPFGTPLDAPKELPFTPKQTRFSFGLALTFDGSNYIFAWMDETNVNEALYQDVFLRRINRDAIPIDDPIHLSATANINADPRFASDGTNALIVWSDGYYAAPVGSAALIEGLHIGQRLPLHQSEHLDVSWNGEDYVVVGANHGTIESTVVSRSGTVLANFTITPSSSPLLRRRAAIAWNGTQHLVVYEVGPQFVGTPSVTIRGTLLNRGGVAISDEFVIDTPPDGTDDVTPAVAWDGQAFIVAWARGRESVIYHDVLSRVVTSEGLVGDLLSVAATTDDEQAPTLLQVADGRVLIGYTRVAPEAGYVPRIFTRILSVPHRQRAVPHSR